MVQYSYTAGCLWAIFLQPWNKMACRASLSSFENRRLCFLRVLPEGTINAGFQLFLIMMYAFLNPVSCNVTGKYENNVMSLKYIFSVDFIFVLKSHARDFLRGNKMNFLTGQHLWNIDFHLLYNGGGSIFIHIRVPQCSLSPIVNLKPAVRHPVRLNIDLYVFFNSKKKNTRK